MSINFESALNAYNAAARRFATGTDEQLRSGAAPEPDKVGAPSFGDLIRSAAVNARETIHEGERMSAEAVMGNADLTDVVMAVNNAEVTLQSVVAIRDKVISAYQEILRMPI